MDCGTLGSSVLHCLPEFAESEILYNISSSAIPFNLSQHQGIFQWVCVCVCVCVYIHKYIYIHSGILHNRILLSHKKEQKFIIFSNIDGLGRCYARWNKPERDRQILYNITYKRILKIKQTSEYSKKRSRLKDIENKPVIISEGGDKWGAGAEGTNYWVKDRASLVAQTVKIPPEMWETWVRSLGWEDPWRRTWQPTPVFLPGESPWTKKPGGLQSMGSQRVGHDWGTSEVHKTGYKNVLYNMGNMANIL